MTPASSPARLAGASPVTGIAGLAIGGMSKSFGPNLAVRDVELEVEPGAFLGLVGPNGAGKTTLLSMAVGLLRPDQGNAWVAGNPVWPAAGPAGPSSCSACCPTAWPCRAS